MRDMTLVAFATWSNLVCCVDAQTTVTTSSLYSTKFSWPQYADLEYATALPKPTATATYAPPYLELSSLAGSQTTTTWASVASPTDLDNEFGNAAWSSLWASFTVSPPPFTTTATATPVRSEELVKPTPLPFTIGKDETDTYQFPADFEWGFTGSALQVEGATQTEGRGPTIIEAMLGQGRPGVPGSGTPDVAVLNYFLYKQDIARLAAIGVKSYSFSISWSRILPFGVPGSPVNQEAIDHYDDLIDTILEYGMVPLVTLNHFDTPLYYATNTSWPGFDHPEFVEGFLNYAKVVLTHYSDRVGTWVTFNEPNVDSSIFKNWKSGYNVVIAHAKVVHFYREQIKGTGKWSLKLAFPIGGFPLPLNPQNPDDVAAAERHIDFSVGHIANPIYLGTQVPLNIIESLGSSAPNFTEEELEYVKGTADYFAFDLYNVGYATTLDDGLDSCVQNSTHAEFPTCVKITTTRSNWQIGAQSNTTPWTWYQHARIIFNYLHTTYPTSGGLFLAEFGWPSFHEYDMTPDQARAELTSTLFYLPTFNEMLKSIHEDGVKFKGALGWAYVDNWEWGTYGERYGVQTFDNETLERSYKRSIFDVVGFISEHSEV